MWTTHDASFQPSPSRSADPSFNDSRDLRKLYVVMLSRIFYLYRHSKPIEKDVAILLISASGTAQWFAGNVDPDLEHSDATK